MAATMVKRTPQLQVIESLLQQNIALQRRFGHSRRLVHSSPSKQSTASPLPIASASQQILSGVTPSAPPTQQEVAEKHASTLARLPTSSVLRTYIITSLSSSPALLGAIFAILRRMLDSTSALTNIEKNPVLNKILKSTFYAQFCSGENKQEVGMSTALAKSRLGYDGVIIEYALEVLGGKNPTAEETTAEIEVWRKGMLLSIDMASPGDFIGLKWSGLGREALALLKAGKEPTPAMEAAMLESCDAAAAKGICLLPGAEEEVTNPGLEGWTQKLQAKYNTKERGYAVLYTTFQCYLKSAPEKVARLIADAKVKGYIAGVKLVRGAYLASEPRHLIWDTIEGTHACYDGIAEAVLKGRYNSILKPVNGELAGKFPERNVVLATHNLNTVRKAQAIRNAQAEKGEPMPKLSYAQLQGMADEISQELVQIAQTQNEANTKIDRPRVYKCMVWGTTTECLNYLLRRAAENKETVGRTADTRRAMGAELWRRWKAGVGLN